MSSVLRFSQVDVFASKRHMGNPVAVVHEADALTTEEMARFARWTNLSETTFLLLPSTPEADYRLRIFTPGGELPFAGHPTLGSCHAWLEAGGTAGQADQIIQECGVGLVRICKNAQGLSFAAPDLLRTGPLESELVADLMLALGLPADALIDHQWVDNGPGWCALLLDSAKRVLDVRPDFLALGTSCLGLVGPYPSGSDSDFEVRAFVPDMGVPEDPVTGSLNASIAQWLIGSGRAPASYVASQGCVLGRAGRIVISSTHDDVWVGGATNTSIRGEVVF
ncbi:PhzF family phenazine biosynthesis protein [Congregibacter variabilis]|uniref:PhzF family phenazine biosynthesis protein n=1 Tax=Congregibacter variabilis TaxID=3081200 RepID=A0ABZ0I3J2_9GAMM|nr:PhzF family phenazine biosynthesis protein [Congregibacter sp. IMCC43200]